MMNAGMNGSGETSMQKLIHVMNSLKCAGMTLAILVVPGVAGVYAQSAYNPYEPMNSQFRAYARPGGLNPFDAMSNNRSQNNTLESELDSLIGGRETASGRSRDSDRYYNSFRKYDEDFNRLYRPNLDVDRAYNERRMTRESDYFKALREKDPKKRAEMMRAFNRGEVASAVKDDEKAQEDVPTRRSRLNADSDFGRSRSSRTTLSPSSERSTTGTSRSGAAAGSGSRSGSGLLGPDRSSSSSRPGSLTQRSGLLSEEIRPTDTPRGFGSMRSREEEKKKGSSSNSGRSSNLPGVPGLVP
jgi:hypothetical protein